ncbi:MAG: ribosomal protein L11 methyltransferase [Flavobacteriales bacterium]|jgi:ribosomal protein L11 methyltransferase
MNYIEFDFKVSPLIPGVEILIAELGMTGFESFVEHETGVLAYIQEDEFKASILEEVRILTNPNFEITFEQKVIEQQNWNAAWESNFEPIFVGDSCVVRAPFHQLEKEYTFDLIIEPKMSFGTGHHETTSLILAQLLEKDLTKKSVIDMGCGTGVLAILAAKQNASPVLAIDIDEWSYENSVENCERNGVPQIQVKLGGAEVIEGSCDLFIANINRNILMQDMPYYVKHMNANATLLLSGFFETDIPILQTEAEQLGLSYVGFTEKNRWVAVEFSK